jgi:hypothetical protein
MENKCGGGCCSNLPNCCSLSLSLSYAAATSRPRLKKKVLLARVAHIQKLVSLLLLLSSPSPLHPLFPSILPSQPPSVPRLLTASRALSHPLFSPSSISRLFKVCKRLSAPFQPFVKSPDSATQKFLCRTNPRFLSLLHGSSKSS